MGIFESLSQTSDKALDLGEYYSKKTLEYYKLKVFQQLVTSSGMFCKTVLIGGFLFLGLMFFAVSGTLALGQLVGNMILACLIIGVLLLLIGGLIYKFRSTIDSIVIKKLAKQFFD